MKRMLLVVVLAACGGSQQPPVQDQAISNSEPAPPVDAAIDAAPSVVDKLAEFCDAMCQCADKACADRVVEEMSRWGQEFSKSAGMAARPTEAETRRIQEITERFGKCMTDLAMKTHGSP